MKKSESKTMNIILIVLGVLLVIFVGIMIWLYLVTGSVPDSLVYSFFGAITGEAGAMGWIKTVKTKNKEREWELQDRELQLEQEQKRLNDMMDALARQEVQNHD